MLFNILYLWTTTILFFSIILQYNTYTGAIYIWLGGFPLIIVIIIFYGKYSVYPNLGKLSLINKLISSDNIVFQIRFLIGIIEMKEDKRESGILLKGFIRNHEDNCHIVDCPLKVVKRNMDNNYNDINLYSTFINQQLILFINRIYLLGITKYPNSSSLRISFALFLYYHQKQKMKAKQELENAEKCSLSFSQQFCVFRFKKLIIEDLDTNQGSNEVLDIANSIAYESHFRQCQQDILSAARLYLEFWTLLSSQNATPDITKLNELSLKVNDTIKNIHNHWKRMQHYKPNDPKALKLYASLYIELMNNKEKGKEILALSKETADKKNLLNDHYDLLMIDEDFSSGNCVIICSAESDNYGALLKASSNACKIFGYLTEDLINGRPIDDLFVDCYNSGVSSFIQDLSSTWNEENSKKEFLLYAKTKQNKTHPVFIRLIDPNKTIGDKIHAKLMIKPEDNINDDLKEYNRSCYFIVNSSLNINITSESVSELVNIIYGNKVVLTELSTLTNIFPEMYKNFDKNEIFNNYNQFNSNKLSDTLLYDLINDSNSSYQDLEIYLKTPQIENWYNNNQNNNVDVSNNELEDKILRIRFKIAKVELKSSQFSDNKLNLENYYNRENNDIRGKSNNQNLNGLFNNNMKNNFDNNINKEIYFAIKVKYDFSSKLAKYKSTLTPNTVSPVKKAFNNNNNNLSMNTTNNEMKNKKTNNVFSVNSISNPSLSLNFDKILRSIAIKNNNQCIMNIIKDKNDSFASVYQWAGLDPYRFHKKETTTKGNYLSDNNTLNTTNINILNKKENSLNPNSLINLKPTNDDYESIHNNKGKNRNDQLNNEEHSRSRRHSGINDYSSEEHEENSEDDYENSQDDNYSDYEEEVEALLRDEIEIGYKRETFFEKINHIKNYSKNVRCYIIKNDNDPREEFLESKLVEYSMLLNNNGFVVDEQSPNVQATTISFKGPKEQTDIKPPASLNKLQYSSLIIFVVLIAYAIIELILNIRAKNILIKNFEMTFFSYQFINEIIWSTYLMRNLLTMRNNNNFNPQDQFFVKNITYIQESIITQNYIILNITQNSLSLSSEHESILSSKVVPLFSLDSYPEITTQYRTLIEAMNEMRITLVNIVENTDRSSIISTNSFVQNFMYNGLNEFLIYLRTNALLFVDLVFTNVDQNRTIFIYFYSVFIFLELVFIYVMYMYLSEVDKDRTKILFAFYEIPSSYLNKLSELCLKFVEKYEKPDNEGSEKVSESNLETDEETQQMKVNKRKISHRGILKSKKKYLLNISLTFIFLCVFFSFNFGKNITMLNTTKDINQIYNTTLQVQSLMNFALNLEKEKIVDQSTRVLQNTGILIINDTINELYSLNNNLYVQHLQKKNIFSANYIDIYKEIMHDDLCNVTSVWVKEDCENQFFHLGEYGLQIILMKYFENLKDMFMNDIKKIVKKDTPQGLLNSGLVEETNRLMYYFIKPGAVEIVDSMREEISDFFKSEFDTKLIVFILFIVITIMLFLLFWLPFQSNLQDEIIRTKKMLEIIPTSIISEIEFLKEI